MDPLLERLRIEFSDRQRANPSYSIRAYARDLNVSLTSLSLFLKNERAPSEATRQRLVEKLALAPVYAKAEPWTPATLEDDEFRLISEWVHLAILNLVRPGAKKKTAEQMAARLDLPLSTIETALQRLIRLRLVRQDKQHYVRLAQKIKTSEDVPSAAIRKLHAEVLGLAQKSLDAVPVGQREISTIFLMMKPTNLARAKELMRKFRSEMSEIFDPHHETSADGELHVLGLQLFPVGKE